jgi:hypothetical protein
MELHKIIADLREQRDRVEEAIAALEKIARQQSRGSGRPPKWLAASRSDLFKKHVGVKSPTLDRAAGG